MTTYRTHPERPPYFVVDLESSQQTATPAPLHLEAYRYGGFALRGHAEWDEPSRLTVTTSEGLGRVAADGAKARWCVLAGEVSGAPVGVAMLAHPQNFRAPETLRVHPEHPYLAFAPVKDGPFTIAPGRPYTTRFRIVTFDGPVDPTHIERLWQDYASPPDVTSRETPPRTGAGQHR